MTLTPLGKEIKKKLIDKDMTQVELAEHHCADPKHPEG